MSYEIIGDERLAAVVNPTKMAVEANVDINGVMFHFFAPGCVDGQYNCVKFCSEERADAMVRTQPNLLRKFTAAAGRALLDLARKEKAQGGDFWTAWQKVFGPVPMQADFVKAQEAKERAQLVKKLTEHGIHDLVNVHIDDLRRYVSNPAIYWEERLEASLGEPISSDPVSILVGSGSGVVAEPAVAEAEKVTFQNVDDIAWDELSKDEKRSLLRSMGENVPPAAGDKWMNDKYMELTSADSGLADEDENIA